MNTLGNRYWLHKKPHPTHALPSHVVEAEIRNVLRVRGYVRLVFYAIIMNSCVCVCVCARVSVYRLFLLFVVFQLVESK
jgi:hypothetical protein